MFAEGEGPHAEDRGNGKDEFSREGDLVCVRRPGGQVWGGKVMRSKHHTSWGVGLRRCRRIQNFKKNIRVPNGAKRIGYKVRGPTHFFVMQQQPKKRLGAKCWHEGRKFRRFEWHCKKRGFKRMGLLDENVAGKGQTSTCRVGGAT